MKENVMKEEDLTKANTPAEEDLTKAKILAKDLCDSYIGLDLKDIQKDIENSVTNKVDEAMTKLMGFFDEYRSNKNNSSKNVEELYDTICTKAEEVKNQLDLSGKLSKWAIGNLKSNLEYLTDRSIDEKPQSQRTSSLMRIIRKQQSDAVYI